jgi:polysaccharide pyruvyl transferase WcaK-like protein
MKITQLGCFDRNFGDSIALMNPRRSINKNINNIEWSSVDLVERFHRVRNSVSICRKILSKISEKNDIFFIGGAGLIEDEKRFGTGWKLPFDKKILSDIKIPIIVFGVGLNFHRRQVSLREPSFEKLCLLIDQSEIFSVRNDGSYENLHGFFKKYKGDMSLFDKVQVVPDAGLIFEPEEQNNRVTEIRNKAFNPAWSNKSILREDSRKLHFILNNPKIKEVLNKEYSFYPHTSKDFNKKVCKNYRLDKEMFKHYSKTKNVYEALSFYDTFHLMFGLHAHAQLISIGKNVPCISYSSVDKISDFVKKYNLEEFNIEPEGKTEKDVTKEFLQLNDRFTNDADFLNSWYNKRDVMVKKFHSEYNEGINNVCNIIK